jgi:hypothetical protein
MVGMLIGDWCGMSFSLFRACEGVKLLVMTRDL